MSSAYDSKCGNERRISFYLHPLVIVETSIKSSQTGKVGEKKLKMRITVNHYSRVFKITGS